MQLGALIFVPALVGCVVLGAVFVLFAAHYYLTVLQSTGSGAKTIDWPSEPIFDQVWKFLYMVWLTGLWLGPAYFLGRAVAGPEGSPWLKIGVPLFVFWVCYPVSQLSSLSGPTIWLPLHPGVFARLAQKPPVVVGFALWSGLTLMFLGVGYYWTFFADGPEKMILGCPLLVVAGLMYGRLLGRLAFALAFTKPFTLKKKKKKPKPTPSRDEAEESDEPRFEQPSDLPPVVTPDEGPLTGYDVTFEDEPKPAKPRKPKPPEMVLGDRPRVVADVVADEPESPPEPEPDEHKPLTFADEAEDARPYGVHKPEVPVEERVPAQVVKPREDEIKLISREDRPKPLKEVWTLDLFAFLAQPSSLAVIGLLTFLCALVGGMVRVARATNPANEG